MTEAEADTRHSSMNIEKIRRAEKTYLKYVFSEDMRRKPKRFWTYIKSKRQESVRLSLIYNKDGFLQFDSSKKADILKNKFQPAYKQIDISFMPDKGPSHHATMQKITIATPVVTKLLRDLNPFKSAGPNLIPTYMLKVAAEKVS